MSNNCEDWRNSVIKSDVDNIKNKLKTMKLCGEDIDMCNTNQLIFSAYELGRREELERKRSELKLFKRFAKF
jgi:hypothetical protein